MVVADALESLAEVKGIDIAAPFDQEWENRLPGVGEREGSCSESGVFGDEDGALEGRGGGGCGEEIESSGVLRLYEVGFEAAAGRRDCVVCGLWSLVRRTQRHPTLEDD